MAQPLGIGYYSHYILYYTIPLHYIVLSYIMYSQIFIFSLYCDKILDKKQLKAGRVCLAHSRGDTVHYSGRVWQQESAWSHCIHSREPEGTEVEPGYQISRLTPFSPAVFKNLPIQGHYQDIKCSNIQDYWGHFTFNPEQEARWQARWGRARDLTPLLASSN